MTSIEDEMVVLRLALLTEDRSKPEQRALRRAAKRLQKRWNLNTITNQRHLAKNATVDITAEVEDTWQEQL